MNNKVKEALKDIPIIKSDLPISAYGSIDLDEFYKTIDRLNKIPYYDDLMKENNKLQSNWNSLREWLMQLKNSYMETDNIFDDAKFRILLNVLDKMNELEGKDKE